MQNALWRGLTLVASEVAKDYAIEKDVRKASGNKELKCPDPECQNSTVRYCHGDIKDAFFAHLNNEECDYSRFDRKDTNQMRNLRCTLHDHFKQKGYNVNMEVKVLPHHYSHLLFVMEEGTRIVIEFGNKSISANKADSLRNQYSDKGIELKWLVIDNSDIPVIEKHTYFMKRYLLNESAKRDLLVVDPESMMLTQYKSDHNQYMFDGHIVTSANYPDTYSETAPINSLVFENNDLSIPGFHDRYQLWISRKQSAFKKKVLVLMAEKKTREEQRKMEMKTEQLRKQSVAGASPHVQRGSSSSYALNKERNKDSDTDRRKPYDNNYEQRKKGILPRMQQQVIPVKDSKGHRWIKCEICGAVETDDKFVTYGGKDHVNLGICYNCRDK